MRVNISCAECGGNRFDYPLVLNDDSMIRCIDCDHEIGTVAQLQDKVVEQLTKGSDGHITG